MTDEHQPREREEHEREPTPEPGADTLKDLSPKEQGSEVKGGPLGSGMKQ
jgi:hypothetical protein